MILKINSNKIQENIFRQTQFIDSSYPKETKKILKNNFDEALDKVDYCFKFIKHKNYNDGKNTFFSPMFSDQNLIFLWFLSRVIWLKSQNDILADKIYILNKMLHSFDCNYKTKLPEIFFVAHGVGVVLGNATYNNFFFVSQNCTVGANQGKYPVIMEKVGLGAGSSVIGECLIGANTSIGSNTQVFERNIGKNKIVMRTNNGKIIVKKSSKELARNFFKY